MKQFVLALLLLALTVALTVANAMAIRKDVAHLTALAERDDVDRLCEELKELDGYLSLTVNHNLLEQVQQNAHAMRAYQGIDEEGAFADYRAAKDNLLMLLQEIEDGETCSFLNIF